MPTLEQSLQSKGVTPAEIKRLTFDSNAFYLSDIKPQLDVLVDDKCSQNLSILFKDVKKYNIVQVLQKLDLNVFGLAFDNGGEYVEKVTLHSKPLWQTGEGQLLVNESFGDGGKVRLENLYIYKKATTVTTEPSAPISPDLSSSDASGLATARSDKLAELQAQLTQTNQAKSQAEQRAESAEKEKGLALEQARQSLELANQLNLLNQGFSNRIALLEEKLNSANERAKTAEQEGDEANQLAQQATQALETLTQQLTQSPETAKEAFVALATGFELYTPSEVAQQVRVALDKNNSEHGLETAGLRRQIANYENKTPPTLLEALPEDNDRIHPTEEVNTSEPLPERASIYVSSEYQAPIQHDTPLFTSDEFVTDTEASNDSEIESTAGGDITWVDTSTESGQNLQEKENNDIIGGGESNSAVEADEKSPETQINNPFSDMENSTWESAVHVFKNQMETNPLGNGLTVPNAQVALEVADALLNNTQALGQARFTEAQISEYKAKLEAFLVIERDLIKLAKTVLGNQFDENKPLVSKNAVLMAYYSLQDRQTSDLAKKVNSIIQTVESSLVLLEKINPNYESDEFITKYAMVEYKKLTDEKAILKAMETS